MNIFISYYSPSFNTKYKVSLNRILYLYLQISKNNLFKSFNNKSHVQSSKKRQTRVKPFENLIQTFAEFEFGVKIGRIAVKINRLKEFLCYVNK